MATCGIKKYDDLPGRVALIDVDALRANLAMYENPTRLDRYFRFVTTPIDTILTYLTGKTAEERLKEQLEEAYEIHHGETESTLTRLKEKVKDVVGL